MDIQVSKIYAVWGVEFPTTLRPKLSGIGVLHQTTPNLPQDPQYTKINKVQNFVSHQHTPMCTVDIPFDAKAFMPNYYLKI